MEARKRGDGEVEGALLSPGLKIGLKKRNPGLKIRLYQKQCMLFGEGTLQYLSKSRYAFGSKELKISFLCFD